MSDEIRVRVNSFGPGRSLALVYIDLVSGKKVARSAGTTDPGEAERRAGELEKSLALGTAGVPSRLTWADFRRRYEEEKLASLSQRSRDAGKVVFGRLESLLNPDRVVKLTATTLSQFQTKLRETGIQETTIGHYLRVIRAALRWGVAVGLIPTAPRIEMPKKAKGRRLMKGRPITAEEFDRMLAAVPKIRPDDSALWIRLVTGLWLSGLRLGEALRLSWDWEAGFSVDLAGKFPAFRIRGDAQKSGRDEVAPMTPDFAEWLLENTPESERTGRVFSLPSSNRTYSGRIIGRIGTQAHVVTDATTADCAKAHDLRRAFGTRWSKRVMPAVLQRLMRHADIQTTMGYYVDLTVADVSAELWADFASREGKISAAGNKTGNIGRFRAGAELRNPLPGKPLQTGAGEAVARFGID